MEAAWRLRVWKSNASRAYLLGDSWEGSPMPEHATKCTREAKKAKGGPKMKNSATNAFKVSPRELVSRVLDRFRKSFWSENQPGVGNLRFRSTFKQLVVLLKVARFCECVGAGRYELQIAPKIKDLTEWIPRIGGFGDPL